MKTERVPHPPQGCPAGGGRPPPRGAADPPLRLLISDQGSDRTPCQSPGAPLLHHLPRGLDSRPPGCQSSFRQSSSHQSSPRQSSPRQSSPCQSSPRQSSPRQSSPRQSSPRQSSPRRSSPDDRLRARQACWRRESLLARRVRVRSPERAHPRVCDLRQPRGRHHRAP